MRVVVPAVLMVLGCQASDAPKYMIGGGGGGGGGSQPGVDAFVQLDGGGSGAAIHGQACLLVDARQPDLCATTGAGGYVVTLDGHTAMTDPDGKFEIAAPTSTNNITWQVTGSTIITSLASFSAVPLVPVMKQTDYFDLANSNSVLPAATFGDVFIHVVHAGSSESMVAATTSPVALYATLFDGGTPTTWTQTGTGPNGMVWVPGLAQGTVAATLTPQTGTPTVATGIPIGDQTLTWVTLNLP